MNTIPNYISAGRILLAILLLFIRPLSNVFYFIYALCGLSDMIDGFIARKFKSESKFGEKLDSLADFILMIVLFIILWPFLDIKVYIIFWVICIILIRIVSFVIVFVKFKTVGMVHTYGNKITGFLLFLYPFWIQSTIFIDVICFIGTLSALEELVIHLTSDQYRGNRRGICKIYSGSCPRKGK